VACIRFPGNVEVLLRVLWELLEEESEECIDVLASRNGIAHGAAAVGVADIDGLIEEDHRSIRIPRVRVIVKLQLGINGRRAKFKEETSEGRAARSAVKPENYRL